MYHDKDKVDKHGIVGEWGVSTNARTKPIMVAESYFWVNNSPEMFHSQELVDQLNSLERNNAGQVSSRSYSDMFMATCFCAYVRKMKELEILPQLQVSADEVQQQNINTVSTLIHAISPIQYSKEQIFERVKKEILGIQPEEEYIPPEEREVFNLPFFFE